MIQICDVIMGAGKTSAAIQYINSHPDKKFIFATPYLTEVERIIKSCPALHFKQPKLSKNSDYSKTRDAHEMLAAGHNIATTHAALTYYSRSMIDLIRSQEYTLILDEAVNVYEEYKVSPNDIAVLIDSGIARMTEDHRIEATGKPYGGGRLGAVYKILQTGDIIQVPNDNGFYKTAFYWVLPPRLFDAFVNTIVLTYMFEGSELYAMFKIYHIDFSYIGVKHTDSGYYFCPVEESQTPDYVYDLRLKIHIHMNERLNAIGENPHALSMNWLGRQPDKRRRLRGALRQYFDLFQGYGVKRFLWTTFKRFEPDLQRRGFKSAFIPMNIRATNDYADRDVLAYCANCFETPVKMRHFKENGVELDEDLYALSTLVQWVWRSAIRNGKEIHVFIPSKRMRNLFIKWIYSFNRPGDAYDLDWYESQA